MAKTLILFTSSYPYGDGETFVANEIPYLASAFDRIVIVSNDTSSPVSHELPGSVTAVRRPYELGARHRLGSVVGLLSPILGRELRRVRQRYGIPLSRRVLATALVSWRKAHRFAGLIRTIAAQAPAGEVHAYSYWANDMALAAAVARRRGWVDRAYCRAHGWDVYMDRTGYLPFRDFLATHLDHFFFVSVDGLRHFESVLGRSYPSLSVSRLGTPPAYASPVARPRPFVLVSCSGLIPLKRVDLIARSLQLVSAETRWIHIGDGPERTSVEAACRDLPGHVRVDLRGSLPNDQVLALYGEVGPSLFINLSRTEGLPVSMMEAMSAGVPVIATDVGGVREIVDHQSNGVLLPADPAPAHVAAALDAFAALPDGSHARYAQAAWDTWNSRFHAERNYGTFVNVVRGSVTS